MALSVAESWELIHGTLENHSRGAFDALAKPATTKELVKLEKTLGVRLPPDLADSLRIHNGMNDSYLDLNRLFDNEALLSTDTIATQWKMMTKMQRDGFFDAGCPSTRTRKIKNDRWWNPQWIPVTDADGSGYCIDLDPGPAGIAGQLFYFYHNGARPRVVVAKTYAEWLGKIARKLARHQFTIEDDSIWLS